MVTALQKKLWRDLWHLRGNVLAIALVIAAGVASFVTSVATHESLLITRDRYYAQQRFADVFAGLVRAPDEVATQLRAIPGVDALDARVVAPLSLELPDFSDPIKGQALGIPAGQEPLTNALYLRAGRLLDPQKSHEAIIASGFADAHALKPGDMLTAIINGRRQTLDIVGIADSPEFIYVIPPGTLFPDFSRWGIVWLADRTLDAMFDMEGAFNSVTLRTSRGAALEDVIDRTDEILARWGGTGAIGREDQLSHRYLAEEFRQLETMATVFPTVFLAVSAFLLNIVIARLIGTQREQIAVLKAFGYRDTAIGFHFAQLAGVILLIGALAGVGLGWWLGVGMTRMYVTLFQFPVFSFVLSPASFGQAVLIAGLAVGLGALQGVRAATRLSPAEGMRPPAPPAFHASAFERLTGGSRWRQGTRMILRNLTARPLRTVLSIIGIAMSCAILMMGQFQVDAIDRMVSAQFAIAQREDLTVELVEAAGPRAVSEVAALPGVVAVEGYRNVPVNLRFGHRSYRTAIRGYPDGAELRRPLTAELGTRTVPASGLLVTDHLAAILGASVGDTIEAQVLNGRRQRLELPIAGVVPEYLGLAGHASLPWLGRVLGEGPVVNEIALLADPRYDREILERLADRPRVAGVSRIDDGIEAFYDTFAEMLVIFTTIFTLLAGTIAFGVVFNSARIALSERARELTSLRVLGFRTSEIGHILLAELAVLTLAAIPVGMAFGYGLCAMLAQNLTSDLYRVPLVVGLGTYGSAGLVVVVAAALSCGFVFSRLHDLDLIEVLKTRE